MLPMWRTFDKGGIVKVAAHEIGNHNYWYELAASNGSAYAKNNLVYYYQNGLRRNKTSKSLYLYIEEVEAEDTRKKREDPLGIVYPSGAEERMEDSSAIHPLWTFES